jgi:hypothetical protein
MDEIRKDLHTILVELDEYVRRDPGPSELQVARTRAASALRDLHDAVPGLRAALILNTRGPNYEDGEEDITIEETKARREKADTALNEFTEASANLKAQLEHAISVIWARIRRLEQIAIS